MMQAKSFSDIDVEQLIAKGRAERSRVLAELLSAAPRKIATAPAAVLGGILRAFERARVMRELRSMDERMLADIGLTVGEIDLVASGKLSRGSLRRPAFQAAANESVAPAARTSHKAA